MNRSWGLRVLKGLLACSAAHWRQRFEEQVLADLEDAWGDLPVDQRVGWVFAMGWDVLKGAMRSHLERPRKPQAVLATPGGSVSGPVDVKGVLRFVAFRLPPLAGAGLLLIAGSLLMGMGAYDLAQFKGHALLGLALIFIGLPRFHRLVAALPAEPHKSATEQVGLNTVMVVVVLMISAAYVAMFQWLTGMASTASGTVVASSFAATMPLSPETLVVMVGLILGLSVLGMVVQGHASRLSAVLCLGLCLGLMGALLIRWNGGNLSGIGVGVLSLPLVFFLAVAFLPVGKHFLMHRFGLLLGLGSLPMLIGFLMAISLDLSKSATEKAGLGETVTWSALDLARAHANSLADVSAGRKPPEAFWATVEELETRRQEWAQYKPWMRLVDVRPVGISALDWCMRLRASDPDFGASHCSKQPDPDRWLIENPAD